MNTALKVRKSICQCNEEREEVVVGKKTKRNFSVLAIVGFDCKHCGRKKLIDLNYIKKL